MEEINKALEICQDKMSDKMVDFDYRRIVLNILIDNPDFCSRLVEYDEETNHDYAFDLMHDIAGLSRNDEHFVTRI